MPIISIATIGKSDTATCPIHKLYTRIAPLSILDIYGAILPVGVEYQFLKRTSIIAEIGMPLFFYGIQSTYTGNSRINSDIKLTTELRFYEKKMFYFWGLQGYMRAQTLFQHDSYFQHYHGSGIESVGFTHATTHKTVVGGGFIGGFREQEGKKIWLEAYLGIGLSYVTASHSNIEVTNKVQKEYEGFPDLMQNYLEGDVIKVYIPLGVKLSYAIGK